ncbi:MAG: antibiotic biosynthesis monooxygenase [Caldilineaceae bacterium]|nr:antibiotic biosynthesis monooxygenase [Caldilineaceae bacterium]
MISLDVYFNAKDGNDAELERVIVDVWMEAMKQQPGFISASLMTPLPQEALDAMGAIKPPFSHEVFSFWESEEQRQAWVARDVHQEVWPQVEEAAEVIVYTVSNCDESWNI